MSAAAAAIRNPPPERTAAMPDTTAPALLSSARSGGGRMTAIRNLPSVMPERGKIKIGMKGKKITSQRGNEFQPPVKLDHFIVTTMERGPDGNFLRDETIHAALGDKPTRVPVRLLYDDPELNLQSRYVAYKGRVMWCSGDGVEASRLGPDNKTRQAVRCPCERSEPGYTGPEKCKINGMLAAIVDQGAAVGGVWKFRTTSWNTVTGLYASLGFLRSVTGGPLAGLPLDLVVSPKAALDPSGQQQTVYVVSVEYRGTLDDLQKRGYEIALGRAKAGLRIETVEAEARAQLALPAPDDAPFPGETADDIVEEYYPENAGGDGAAAYGNAGGNGRPRPTRADFHGGSQQQGGQQQDDRQKDGHQQEGRQQDGPEPDSQEQERNFELVTPDGEVHVLLTPAAYAANFIAAVEQIGRDKPTLQGFMETNQAQVHAIHAVSPDLAGDMAETYNEALKACDAPPPQAKAKAKIEPQAPPPPPPPKREPVPALARWGQPPAAHQTARACAESARAIVVQFVDLGELDDWVRRSTGTLELLSKYASTDYAAVTKLIAVRRKALGGGA